jgi:hypothetical protein
MSETETFTWAKVLRRCQTGLGLNPRSDPVHGRARDQRERYLTALAIQLNPVSLRLDSAFLGGHI